MNTLNAVLIDVENNKAQAVKVADSLDAFYNVLNCDCIDIVTRKIGDTYFDIVCDDEGLFKENNKMSALNSAFHPVLIGNLLVTGTADSEGNLTSLTPEQQKYILSKVVKYSTIKHPEPYVMLSNVD